MIPGSVNIPKIEFNAFYVPVRGEVYLCWEKVNGIEQYMIFRNSNELITGTIEDFKRPQIFDIDHWTELFRPDTRNWLYYIDNSVQKYQQYHYSVSGIGGMGATAKSRLVTLKTE